MAYKLALFAAAINDFAEAEQWYQNQSPTTATRFAQAYLKASQAITENPLQFPIIYQDKIRRARFGKPFPYSLLFFEQEDTIYITAVFHEKRNPTIWQGRIQ